MPIIYRLVILTLGLFLMQACHHRQHTTKLINPRLLIDLTGIERYQFNGKISFSDGRDGGSGGLQWQSNDGLINARLKAPLGSKSWRIIENEMTAAQLIVDGSAVYAESAEMLVSEQLGWPVPWQQLKSWVIGQPYNKAVQVNWQVDGFSLTENGWQIEYSRLKAHPNHSSQLLPHKMVARKGQYAIKLSIKQWVW